MPTQTPLEQRASAALTALDLSGEEAALCAQALKRGHSAESLLKTLGFPTVSSAEAYTRARLAGSVSTRTVEAFANALQAQSAARTIV